MAARPDRPPRADAVRNRARILDAAETVFNEHGAAASTEEVARRAGVGVGTVFRHFPTKTELLTAILRRDVERLNDEIAELVDSADPATAFFEFFTRLVTRACGKKIVVDLLGDAAEQLRARKPVDVWRSAVERLLSAAQRAGTVRDDVRPPEVLALLLGTCQAAVTAGWSPKVRDAVLTIVFDGLRPRA